MAKLVRQLLDRAAQQRPAAIPLPRRGDHVEAWLKQQRDVSTSWSAWQELDRLLDDYRLHADTRTPLDQHCCEGGNDDDCAGCYDAREARGA